LSTLRLHVDSPIVAGKPIALDDDRARYVSRVLRLRRGDEIIVFDGSGPEFRGTITSLGRNTASVDVTDELAVDRESPLRVHLLQGISRGDRMDHVVQKTTELGVTRISPVLTEYSVVKLTSERAAKRARHWRGIVASACEQCGRNVLPTVDEPVALRDALAEFVGQPGTRIFLDPRGPAGSAGLRPADNRLALLIGPEGGFSAEERELAKAAGYVATSFGPRVLRTETAATAALAVLQSRFGDLG
jgi:16S rRNA (uracil1498-N3)-methyltransferase